MMNIQTSEDVMDILVSLPQSQAKLRGKNTIVIYQRLKRHVIGNVHGQNSQQ